MYFLESTYSMSSFTTAVRKRLVLRRYIQQMEVKTAPINFKNTALFYTDSIPKPGCKKQMFSNTKTDYELLRC